MIEVLRLSHRVSRDPRISTHVALTARAFGASKIYYSGQKDSNVEDTVNKITENFGGPFEIEYVKDALKLAEEKKKKGFFIVHLTMYGLKIQKEIKDIKKQKNILVLVGSEKVLPEFYKIADKNIAVTGQPHSEVMALGLFLDMCFDRKELDKNFDNGKMLIIPQNLGKNVKKLKE
ncbi:MAG: tRNA (cytidine(56)-2'-O)-methyltransferase [Candidatus Nanoarchaeia archaeon]